MRNLIFGLTDMLTNIKNIKSNRLTPLLSLEEMKGHAVKERILHSVRKGIPFYTKTGVRLLITLILVGIVPNLLAQASFTEAEKVTLFTDRSIYITGEQVNFSAFISQTGELNSKIIYAEVLSADGRKIAYGKFPIIELAASGSLELQEDVTTGVYFIRAYTRYMRNAGPASYAMQAIKIINPSKNDILPGDESLTFAAAQGSDAITGQVRFELDKESFTTGEEVTSQLVFSKDLANIISGLSVTVVPEEASFSKEVTAGTSSPDFTTLRYLPEKNGLTLSGTVTEQTTPANLNNKGAEETTKPVEGVAVTLSVIENVHDFQTVYTNENGRFTFTLPDLMGLSDIYTGLRSNDTTRYRMLIDHEFCVLPLNLSQPRFSLTESERALALKMAQNKEVTSIYHSNAIKTPHDTSQPIRDFKGAFYGRPDYTLLLKDYIQLPTLEEYFNELPGYVKVRKRDGVKYFKVLGDQPEMEFYDPIILVDWVYINDPERILAASPSSIDRIEMFNTPYMKGNTIYGGIISIITKKGDLAGIDLPPSGYFISYHFLDPSYTSPEYQLDPDTPDSRNTLLFEPQLKLNDSGNADITFRTPHTPGRWVIRLNGVTKHGSVFSVSQPFTVN